MKWLVALAFFGIFLAGCYVRHPGNNVGVSTPQVYYTEVCNFNIETHQWKCTHTRRWKDHK